MIFLLFYIEFWSSISRAKIITLLKSSKVKNATIDVKNQ